MLKVAAIVTAAGSGTRMGAERPKQFLALGGLPVLARTLRAMEASPLVEAVLPVVPADQLDWVGRALARWRLTRCLPPVAGGPRRRDSVRLGFEALPPCRVVLVHDGVRPFVSPALVAGVVAAAARHGAAVPALRPPETVKWSEDGRLVGKTLDRRRVWLAQTPQGFRREVLARAYELCGEEDFTDEASLAEEAGLEVALVEGLPGNIKITTPADLAVARALLRTVRRGPS